MVLSRYCSWHWSHCWLVASCDLPGLWPEREKTEGRNRSVGKVALEKHVKQDSQ